jgi:hypothetical protein
MKKLPHGLHFMHPIITSFSIARTAWICLQVPVLRQRPFVRLT